MANILIIDDEANIRSSLKSALERRGHKVVTGQNFAEGERLSQATYDVIFLDVFLPDGNGVDLLKKIIARDKDKTIVMISGHADIDTAINSIRLGAYDFIEKPISLDRILVTLDNATRKNRLSYEKDRLSSLVYGEIIGRSKSIRKLKKSVKQAADKTTRFLICGESGTGKELIAHMIHRCGKFSDGAFVAVNCAALPHELIEAELFGHTAGAFSGAKKSRRGRFIEADNGSIFLDEISEMSPAAQAKILRAIESGEITPVGSDSTQKINCNIITASNKDLNMMVKEGSFRQDLLFRLNVVQFDIPPLRERKDDIPLLVEHFLLRFADETAVATKKLTAEAMSVLQNYHFPGNIRELKNLMERINIYCDNSTVSINDIIPLLPKTSPVTSESLKSAVDEFEKEFILMALARYNGNVAETARQLGLERSHLYKKMRKYDINQD